MTDHKSSRSWWSKNIGDSHENTKKTTQICLMFHFLSLHLHFQSEDFRRTCKSTTPHPSHRQFNHLKQLKTLEHPSEGSHGSPQFSKRKACRSLALTPGLTLYINLREKQKWNHFHFGRLHLTFLRSRCLHVNLGKLLLPLPMIRRYLTCLSSSKKKNAIFVFFNHLPQHYSWSYLWGMPVKFQLIIGKTVGSETLV